MIRRGQRAVDAMDERAGEIWEFAIDAMNGTSRPAPEHVPDWHENPHWAMVNLAGDVLRLCEEVKRCWAVLDRIAQSNTCICLAEDGGGDHNNPECPVAIAAEALKGR